MSRFRVVALSLSLAVVAGVGLVLGEDDDKQVERKDIPEAVWKTASQFSEGGELSKCSLGDEDGLKIYELVFKKDDRKIEVQTTKAGELFATEEKVDEKDVPEAVKARGAKLFKPGMKVSYERSVVVLYEAAAKDEKGKEKEYLINQAGAAFKEVAGGIFEHEGEKGEHDGKEKK